MLQHLVKPFYYSNVPRVSVIWCIAQDRHQLPSFKSILQCNLAALTIQYPRFESGNERAYMRGMYWLTSAILTMRTTPLVLLFRKLTGREFSEVKLET